MNYFTNWNVFLMFVVLVVICDILLCFYKCNFKPLNYFLVAIMCISYPMNLLTGFVILIILSFIIATLNSIFSLLSINIVLSSYIIFLSLTVISMILGGFINYKIYRKSHKDITIYEFSKFKFFSVMFIPLYIYFLYCCYYLNRNEMIVYALFFIIPIATIAFSHIYSSIKILLITKKR